jgi:hypothetical protein
MIQTHNTPRSFWLTIIAITLIANLAVIRSSFLRFDELGVNLYRSIWGGMLLLYFGVLAACIWLAIYIIRFDRSPFNISSPFSQLRLDDPQWRVLGLIVFLAIVILIPYIKFTLNIGQDIKNYSKDPVLIALVYYWMCWWAILLAMAALKIAFKTTWQAGFASALVLLGLSYEVFIRFNVVTTYPLSMGWSEGSRFYYASLYFSKWIYGEAFPLSTLHPTRYVLQSIPFLIPGLGITEHRFWQFLLWIGLTAGAAIALANRVALPGERAVKWLFAGWFFLFLLRFGVYYHLEVMVIVPLLWASTKHPWRSTMAVLFASLWAGVSRVNWFPMPAMLAIAIYLLETPVKSFTSNSAATPFKRILAYISLPALWTVVGLCSALAAQAAYIPLSGNAGNVEAFTSSLTSDLLWYRLWPNQNHALGILPATLILSGPLLITIMIAVRRWQALHPLRWLGLFSMILALFFGSLVVSVKIGGGGDLHNMDTYAVLLGVVAAYFIGGRVQVEPGERQLQVRPWPVLTIALFIPILFLIPSLYSYPKYDEFKNQEAYRQLIQAVNDAAKNGPVLFINERQLVTFGDVRVPLVPDYEAVTLMEMAMSGNQVYLDRFYDDLADHRFSAIVVSKQNLTIKQTGPLAEENNIWNSRVSPYILCHYSPMILIEPQGNRMEIYMPAAESRNCP